MLVDTAKATPLAIIEAVDSDSSGDSDIVLVSYLQNYRTVQGIALPTRVVSRRVSRKAGLDRIEATRDYKDFRLSFTPR